MSLNTIIIIDWDDTLFPTTAYRQQKISLHNLKILDNTIPKVLNYNNTYIVSNASNEWLYKSINMLPKTKEHIKKYKIPVISAREKYELKKNLR